MKPIMTNVEEFHNDRTPEDVEKKIQIADLKDFTDDDIITAMQSPYVANNPLVPKIDRIKQLAELTKQMDSINNTDALTPVEETVNPEYILTAAMKMRLANDNAIGWFLGRTVATILASWGGAVLGGPIGSGIAATAAYATSRGFETYFSHSAVRYAVEHPRETYKETHGLDSEPEFITGVKDSLAAVKTIEQNKDDLSYTLGTIAGTLANTIAFMGAPSVAVFGGMGVDEGFYTYNQTDSLGQAAINGLFTTAAGIGGGVVASKVIKGGAVKLLGLGELAPIVDKELQKATLENSWFAKAQTKVIDTLFYNPSITPRLLAGTEGAISFGAMDAGTQVGQIISSKLSDKKLKVSFSPERIAEAAVLGALFHQIGTTKSIEQEFGIRDYIKTRDPYVFPPLTDNKRYKVQEAVSQSLKYKPFSKVEMDWFKNSPEPKDKLGYNSYDTLTDNNPKIIERDYEEYMKNIKNPYKNESKDINPKPKKEQKKQTTKKKNSSNKKKKKK